MTPATPAQDEQRAACDPERGAAGKGGVGCSLLQYCPRMLECGRTRGVSGRISWTHILWDHTPGGNVAHVEEHDLTTDEVDYVLENYESADSSGSSGLPCVFGDTPDGRHVVVIYEEVDDETVAPVTAYEVPRRRRRGHR